MVQRVYRLITPEQTVLQQVCLVVNAFFILLLFIARDLGLYMYLFLFGMCLPF